MATAKSSIVSCPLMISEGSMSIAHPSEGSTPHSVGLPSASSIEQAEKRIPHPFGSSEEKGIPEPPPVVAPISLTLGMSFIMDAKLLAAEYVDLLVRTATGFNQNIDPFGAGS